LQRDARTVLPLGLVGRGPWASSIERTLHLFPDVSVTRIPRRESPPADIAGVLIATQSATHAEVALRYIEAGVKTFIEKPMTTSVADAERIRMAAERSGTPVFVGHIYLHHPAFLAALDLLPGLGAIRYVVCEGMNDRPRADSSVLWDWLPHDLSVASTIFRRHPASAQAWSLSGGAMPEAAVAKFLYGDVPMISKVSWLSPVQRRIMTIVGEKLTLIFDDKAHRHLAIHDKQGGITYPTYPDELALTRELSAFINAVRSGKLDPAQVEMGVAVVRGISAAEASIRLDGKPVPTGC
jgi:predicted dehydrogenase